MPVVVVVLLALPAVAGAQPADVKSRLKAEGYQTELPGSTMPAPEPGRSFTSRPHPDLKAPAPPSGAVALSRVLLWVVAIAVVIVAIVWIIMAVARGRGEEARTNGPMADTARGRMEGDALSGDDLRLLLGRAFRLLEDRGLIVLGPAVTGREVLARARLAPEARDCLARLVRAVELTWFGGVAVGEVERMGCAAGFARLKELLEAT